MRNNVPDYSHHFDHLSGDTQLETENKRTMTEVTNPAGESVDVVEHHKHFGQLQKSTGSFLRTLEGWRIRTDFSVHPLPHALLVTRFLVAEYVTAYEVGMSAAQDGYDFATSGLSLTTIVTSDIGQAERESYIAQMQSFANQGKTKSEQALENMRELRRKLNAHLERMKTGPEDSVGQDDIAVFEKNLSILHQFEECMDWYIKWWTKTGMTSSHQDTNIALYARHGGDLRLRGIQLQWKNLQDVYLHYRIEMQALQDQYSGVFKLVHNLKPSDIIDIPTYPSLGPMLEGGAVQRQVTSKRNARRHSNTPPLPLSTPDGPGQRTLNQTESNQRQTSTGIPLRQNSKISDRRIVKETVSGDTPQPPVEGSDIQQEISGSDRQKAKGSKPFNHTLGSTSGRSSESENATMADNRSTGRRNEESSAGRERSSKKTAIVISNPPEVLPLDDSSASLNTARTTKEESSNTSNSVADRQQGLTSSKHIDKDFVETELGTDKPPSFHSSSSKKGKSSGYHDTSQKLLKTDSKGSHHTPPDSTTSGLKRLPSANQRTSVEQETGDKTGNTAVFHEPKHIVEGSKLLSDLGDIISSSEKFDTLSLGLLDDLDVPSSKFSNEEAYPLAPSTSSTKPPVNRKPSKRSAQERIQQFSPNLGLNPVPPTNIELNTMSSSHSHSSTKAIVQHESPNIPSRSESESLVPPQPPKSTKAIEQPAQRENSSQTQPSSSRGGDWADQQLRRNSPKDDRSFPLAHLPVSDSESRDNSSSSTLRGNRSTSVAPSSGEHARDNGSTANASDGLVNTSKVGRSGRPEPTSEEGKAIRTVPIEANSGEEVRAVTPQRTSSKKTSSKPDSPPQHFVEETPADNAGCGCCVIM